MEKKEPRSTVLYVRIKPSYLAWLKKDAARLGYKSMSEYVERAIEKMKGH